MSRTVPSENFMATVAANVDNSNMSDANFREFIRNSLPIVIYNGCKYETQAERFGYNSKTYNGGFDHPCGGSYETQAERFGYK